MSIAQFDTISPTNQFSSKINLIYHPSIRPKTINLRITLSKVLQWIMLHDPSIESHQILPSTSIISQCFIFSPRRIFLEMKKITKISFSHSILLTLSPTDFHVSPTLFSAHYDRVFHKRHDQSLHSPRPCKYPKPYNQLCC